MEVVERSSSNDLSSAPNSDIDGPSALRVSTPNISNTIVVSRDTSTNYTSTPGLGLRGVSDNAAPTNTNRQEPAPKQRRPRKKKDSDVAPTATEKKERATRKPRGASTVAARKKLKTEPVEAVPSPQIVPSTTEAAYPRPLQQSVIDMKPSSATPNEAAKFSQNGFSNNSPMLSAPQPLSQQQYNPTPPPPPPPPPQQHPVARSMAYDPVRSLTMPRPAEPHPNAHTSHGNLSTPPRPVYNPSTSPAISGIINPPDNDASETKASKVSYPSSDIQRSSSSMGQSQMNTNSVPMEVDVPVAKAELAKKTTPEAVLSKPVAKTRAKEQPPPLPTGLGLLSSTLFGGDSGIETNKNLSEKGTSIVLHVDLKGSNNKVINFARMAEEKYGFAALYPRQAAQKERLAKVAAAGAALERAGSGNKGTPAGESGDEDVSVDIDRDSDNDGDVAMSGMNGTGEAVNSGTDGPVPKRRRRKDEYDADDPFVDDSEMLWEAQAAASKDGFFVYCGPLVPEGEKPTVERADGTVKRGRGRGRGGGPGSRGGRGAAAAARDAEGGSSRGGGPGSRGGGVTRKPRITKAERAQREMEKKQREQMAVLAAKPPNYQP